MIDSGTMNKDSRVYMHGILNAEVDEGSPTNVADFDSYFFPQDEPIVTTHEKQPRQLSSRIQHNNNNSGLNHVSNNTNQEAKNATSSNSSRGGSYKSSEINISRLKALRNQRNKPFRGKSSGEMQPEKIANGAIKTNDATKTGERSMGETTMQTAIRSEKENVNTRASVDRKSGSIHGSIQRLKALRNLSIGGKRSEKQGAPRDRSVSAPRMRPPSRTRAHGRENIKVNVNKCNSQTNDRMEKSKGSLNNNIIHMKTEPPTKSLRHASPCARNDASSKPNIKNVGNPASELNVKNCPNTPPTNARSIANIIKRRKAKPQLHTMATLSKSAVLVQCAARQFLAKAKARQQRRILGAMTGIILLQCLIKKWIIANRELKRSAATEIQRSYRGYIYREGKRRNRAVTMIQAVYRGSTQRDHYVDLMCNAILFQSVVRRWIETTKVQKMLYLQKLILCQAMARRMIGLQWFKKVQLCRKEKWAVLLQKSFRGYICREKLRRNRAATTIQSVHRSHSVQKVFMTVIMSVILCQSVVRRMIDTMKVHKIRLAHILSEGLKSSDSVVTVQSDLRCCAERREYVDMVHSAIKCQSLVRKMIDMRQVHRLGIERGSTRIQSAYRSYIVRKVFVDLLRDVVICQSVMRRKLGSIKVHRLQLARKEDAAVIIQKSYRGFTRRKVYSGFICKLIMCQSIARQLISARTVLKIRRDMIFRAATTLQKSLRGFICRKNLRRNSAALKIQSVYRGHPVRKVVIAFCCNIIVCQSWVRRRIAMTKVKSLQLTRKQDATTKIQSVYRRHLAQKKYRANKILKLRLAVLRNKITSSQLRDAAARMIQFVYRAYSEREGYIAFIGNLIFCQSIVRRILVTRRVHKLRLIEFHGTVFEIRTIHFAAATKIQAFIRCRLAKMSYRKDMENLVLCQKAVERLFARREAHQLRRKKQFETATQTREVERAAATAIQTVYRGYATRMDVIMTVVDVMLCQSIVRRRMAMNRVNSMRREIRAVHDEASTCIQTVVRRHLAVRFVRLMAKNAEDEREARERAVDGATLKIQSTYRCHLERTRFNRIINEVIHCQSVIRRILAGRKSNKLKCIVRTRAVTQERSVYSCAATKIQATFRSYFAQLEFVLTKEDVIICQSVVRRMIAIRRRAKLAFLLQSNAASIIQSFYRTHLEKVQESKSAKDHAATLIQSVVRYQLSVKILLTMVENTKRKRWVEAITRLQAHHRGIKVRRTVDSSQSVTRKRALVKLQAFFRGQIVRTILEFETYFATVLQSAVRRKLSLAKIKRMKIERQEWAVVKIQSLFRANLVREDMEYLHSCASQIQALYRQRKALGQKHLYFIVLLQAFFRGMLTRKSCRKCVSAATIIQSNWRSHSCQVDYVLVLMDIITVQSIARRWLTVKRQRCSNLTNSKVDSGNPGQLKCGEDLSFISTNPQFASSFDIEVSELMQEIEQAQSAVTKFWD